MSALIAVEACHGRLTFANRPPAGTSPWDWWWSTFADEVPLYTEDLGRQWASTRWTASGPYVVFHHRLSPVQRTLALTHELHHLAVGGVCSSRCPKNERKVVRATTRWLLPDVQALAERLCTASVGAVGRELGVASSTIWERLLEATPRERALIDEIMATGPAWRADARAALPTVAAS